jgi:F-type H+-transporting ATPase subunit delta
VASTLQGAAKSYARALFELAGERGQAYTTGLELTQVADLLDREPALGDFFGRPWVAATIKRNAASELAARIGLSPLLRDFLALVAARGRVAALPEIAVAFRDLADAAAGRVRARVRSAVPLTDLERKTLAAQLARAIERERGVRASVVLDETVDSNLLGGFVAEVGSLVVDGSLDVQLARLRQQLVRG